MQQERQAGVRRGAGARAGARGVGVPGGRTTRCARRWRSTCRAPRLWRRRTAICSRLRRRTSARRAAGNPTARRTACCVRNTRTRTFVILATSHYGEPETFGLTRKTFRTPLGDAPTDTALVDWLAARGGNGVEMEDYCHSFEHTVELQVIFLQHVLGPGVKILPVLVRAVRAQHLRGRQSGRRRQGEGVLRRARRAARARRRPPVLGAGRGHGAHGRALSATASRRWRARARCRK